MKLLHRTLALGLLLILCLTAAALPVSAANVTCDVAGGQLYFNPATGAVTGYEGAPTDVVIPDKIGGTPVTAIGYQAFQNCQTLTTLTLPDTLTSIGGYAFQNCSSLTAIALPDSVTTLEDNAFYGCTALTDVRLSAGLTTLPQMAFYGCSSLESLTIPDGVTSIGQYAFMSSGLVSLTLPDSVTTVGAMAFSGCEQLTSADLGSISSLGSQSFARCSSLQDIRLSHNLNALPASAFAQCAALEEITIPEGVTQFGDGAFQACSSLRVVHLPSTLTSIPSNAFSGCSAVTDVYYNGTPETWAAMTRRAQIDGLTGAAFHYSDPVAGFTDVGTLDYFADAVQWAVDNGVTTGTAAATFAPDLTVTRAQAVTFLWRAAGSPEPDAAVSPFTDVADPSAYYYKAVLWAAQQGIVAGTSSTTFAPFAAVAYDQMLTFLCRASGAEAAGSDWSAAALQWAADNGLTDGLYFAPKDACPRADVVYCLWRQLG